MKQQIKKLLTQKKELFEEKAFAENDLIKECVLMVENDLKECSE